MNRKSIRLFGIMLIILLAATVMWSATNDGVAVSCSHPADGVQLPATSSYMANNNAELREVAFAQKIKDCSQLKTSFDRCLCQYNNCNAGCRTGDNECVNKCTRAFNQCK